MKQLLRSVKCGWAASKLFVVVVVVVVVVVGWLARGDDARSASCFLLLSATGLSFVHTASAPSKNEAQPQKIIA